MYVDIHINICQSKLLGLLLAILNDTNKYQMLSHFGDITHYKLTRDTVWIGVTVGQTRL